MYIKMTEYDIIKQLYNRLNIIEQKYRNTYFAKEYYGLNINTKILNSVLFMQANLPASKLISKNLDCLPVGMVSQEHSFGLALY